MVKVDKRSASTAHEEDGSDSSGSYEWVTDSDQSDLEPEAAVLEASLLKTLSSMIPFTKAYKEANEAMFELNDIKGMQAEVARCVEIKEMLDQGDHEEALVELKNDTIMGFSDFNRSKHQLEAEGKWAFETQRQKVKRMERAAKESLVPGGAAVEVATGAEGHFRKKLIVRRIFDEQRNWDMAHSTTDFGQDLNWNGSTELGGDDETITTNTKHTGCKWRGENDEGVDHMCNNARLVHPWKTYKDEFGAEVPEQISFCHYHAKFCLDPRKSHGDATVKIKEPNEFALCNECYVVQLKRPPRTLPAFRIPGVARAARSTAGGGVKQGKNASEDSALNEDTECNWKPNRVLIEERGLSCGNKVFRNPESKSLCRQCGWHVQECCMTHKDADPAKKRIVVANEHGLCVAHYVSKFGKPPKKMELPYPGMEKREKEVEHEPTIEEQMKHFLRPKGLGPEMDKPPAIYHPPSPPKTWREKWRKKARIKAHELEIKTVGGLFATRIQKNQRMWSVQSEAIRIRSAKLSILRHNAASRIQALVRRVIMKDEIEELKTNTLGAVNLVSRLVRGLLARKKVKRKKAARVLQRGGLRAVAGALMYAVKSTLEVRHEHEHEEWGNVTLQRYAKGFVTRLRVRQRKEQVRLETISSLLMQKIYRGRIGRRRFDHLTRQKLWHDANATIVQSHFRRILEVYFVQHRRVTWNAAAITIQRRGHMYAAKMMAYHERQSISAFWDWLAPTLPKSAFTNLLPKTFYGSYRFHVDEKQVFAMNMTERAKYFKDLATQAAYDESIAHPSLHSASAASVVNPGEQFFLKYDREGCGQVSRMDFGNALHDMWDAAGCPLLGKEVKSLTSRFDHHNDGYIEYSRFLRFASSHGRPCAVHGRLICADCISYGQCVRHGIVTCKKFKASISSPNVCLCGAYISAHEMIPEPNNDEEYDNGYISKEQMDSVFKKEKKPDMDKPARGGEGVFMKEVINLTRNEIEHDQDMLTRTHGQLPLPSAFKDPSMNRIEKQPSMKKILNASNPLPVPPQLKLHRIEEQPSLHRERALTLTRTEIAQAGEGLLHPRRQLGDEGKHVATLPNRDQHWHSISQNQYQTLSHLVPSQAAPSYTESVKLLHHENHLVSYANETFLKREQSKNELEQGFKITTPIPLISDGELRLTTKAVDLYLHIFNKVRDEKLRLIEDDVAFVNFCFNFIVFMERHWRKLCKDIRMGEINKNLPISAAKREALESAMLPNPKRAKAFEEGLRKLGFHDRASGTKATSKTVGANDDGDAKKFKRHVLDKIRENEVPLSAREHRVAMNIKMDSDYEERSFKSNPHTDKERKGLRKSVVAAKSIAVVAAESNLRSAQRGESIGDICEDSLEDDMTLSVASYEGSINTIDSKKSHNSKASRKSNASKMSTTTQGSMSSQFNITDEMRKMTIRDYLTLSIDHDETADSMSVKFPKRLVRRASEGDLRPMTQQNLFKSGHNLRKIPLPEPDEVIAQPHRTVKGFICGHPGCGQVFGSEHSVKMHQKQHELRSRLAVATPKTDQYLLSVFPKDIPWKKFPFSQISASAAPFTCPLDGCNKTYPSADAVKKHVQMGHSKGEVMTLVNKLTAQSTGKKLGVEFLGNFRLVPPFAPPDGVPCLLCPHHAPPNIKCPICLDCIKAKGPMPPIKFYQSCKALIVNEDNQRVQMTFDVSEFERGPLIYPRTGGRKLKYCQLRAVCVDTLGHNFAAISQFYTYNEMKNLGFHKWGDFGRDAVDRDHEMFMETEVTWMRLEDLKGSCYTLCCERDEYKKKKLMGELPKEVGKHHHEARFCRSTFSRITLEAGEKRESIFRGGGGGGGDGKGEKYKQMMKEAGVW